MGTQNQAPASAEAGQKNSPPFISSAAGSKADIAGIGLTLFPNDRKGDNPDAPDFTGFVTEGGERVYVSAWAVQGGTKPNGEAYEPFLSLRSSKRVGNGYEQTGSGTAQGMNTYKGEPVDPEKRSRVIANLTFKDGREIVATGYATQLLADNPEVSAAFGFTGAVNAKGPEASEERKSPKP